MIYLRLTLALVALGLLLPLGGVQADPLKNGLTAHWQLNKVLGDRIEDVSGNGRDAFGDYVEIVEGRGGRVMRFDGEKSSVHVPDDAVFEITGDYGVSFWIRVEANSEKDGPIYAQPGFGISNFRGGLRITFRNPEYPNTGYSDLFGPKINDGEWHHIVFSYMADSGEVGLFLDAQEAERRVFAHKPEVGIPTTIGFAGRLHFEGELSDLRVYARSLDLVDVSALMDAKVAP